MATIIKPLNRSHVGRAARLHRRGAVWFYRGKATPSVLRAFYDAHANRDYTIGAVVIDDERDDVAGVVCGGTSPQEAGRWLGRRRRWRSLGARLTGGRDLSRGGWKVESLRRAYICCLVRGEQLSSRDLRRLVDAWCAAAASRGAEAAYLPAGAAPPGGEDLGFVVGAGDDEGWWVRRL